ncbi:MAG: DUF975 family protein [Christensenellaceae bacterium]
MFARAQIKAIAKQNFRNNYGISVGAWLLAMLVVAVGSGITFGLGAIFIAPPMQVGMAYFFLCIYRGQTPTLGTMFDSGFSNYWRSIGGILLMELFVFLWSLLFIIPGIIKAYAYMMTPYLLADHPDIPASEALQISSKIMHGHKMDLFIMHLSFLGWAILGGITCGLTEILYSAEYSAISFAGAYEELKRDALATGRITPMDLERRPPAM